MDTIRVLRILEYVGPRDKVEATLQNNAVQTSKTFGSVTIRSATLDNYPEILFSKEPVALEGDVPQWMLDDPLQPLPVKMIGCRTCFGSGGKRANPCTVCNGTGKVPKE